VREAWSQDDTDVESGCRRSSSFVTAAAQRWAAALDFPAHAIDDQGAIKVADGVVEVVSEGLWRFFGR